MLMPKVSVLIPTYNYARYVGLAVESALMQSYPNLEVIVIDDGSTDNTQEVLKPYLSRINYLYKPNGGTGGALNLGIAKSSGKYICWLSSDDVFYPDKVAKQVQLMESNPTQGFCYTSFAVIEADGKHHYDIHSPYYPDRKEMVVKLMEGCFINGSTVMMRRAALSVVGVFDEAMGTVHDYDLWFRFLRHFPCGFIDEILIGYRWHGENGSFHVRPDCVIPAQERAKKLFPEWLA